MSEAESLLTIANRELERVRTLVARGVSSDAELDSARSNQLARAAHVEVTRAQEARARASVEAARIRLGYTEVAAIIPGKAHRAFIGAVLLRAGAEMVHGALAGNA